MFMWFWEKEAGRGKGDRKMAGVMDFVKPYCVCALVVYNNDIGNSRRDVASDLRNRETEAGNVRRMRQRGGRISIPAAIYMEVINMAWVRVGQVPKKQRFSISIDKDEYPALADYAFKFEYREGNKALCQLLEYGRQVEALAKQHLGEANDPQAVSDLVQRIASTAPASAPGTLSLNAGAEGAPQ